MQVVLNQALGSIRDLFDYLESIEQTDALIQYTPTPIDTPDLHRLSSNINNLLVKFRTKKVFEYNAVIISTYGILENFMESIIIYYLDAVNALFSSYQKLPRTILENHFDLSAQLMRNSDKPKYADKVDKETIITNLHSCIANSKSYKLNSYAYIHHTSNFRHDTVSNLLKQVGINDLSNKMLNCNSFDTYLQKRYQTKNTASISSDKVFSLLDDLAQRRNDVSHGVNNGIVDRTYQHDYIDYIKAYIQGIYHILSQELYSLIQGHLTRISISDIKHCFKKHIICFGHTEGTLEVGALILAKSNDTFPEYKVSTVRRIEVQRNVYDEINWDKPVNICMELDNFINVNVNYTFYTIKQRAKNIFKLI